MLSKLFLLVLGLSLLACGSDDGDAQPAAQCPPAAGSTHVIEYIDRPVEVEVPVQVRIPQKFENIYRFVNGSGDVSTLELRVNSLDLVSIESINQVLVSRNPQNGTAGEHPRISMDGLNIINNRVSFTRDLNYTSGQDLEEDVSGSNITGRKKTDFSLYFNEQDKLVLEIKIYANQSGQNINEVVAHRVFVAE